MAKIPTLIFNSCTPSAYMESSPPTSLNPNPESEQHFPHPSSPPSHTRMSMSSSSSLLSPTFYNNHSTQNHESAPPETLQLNAAAVQRQFHTTTATTPSSGGKSPSPSSNLDVCLSPSETLSGSRSGQNGDRVVEEGNDNAGPEDSRALAVVPHPEENKVVLAMHTPKIGPRSAEMVRVSRMDSETKMRFYKEYKALRILYDGLRVSPVLISGERGAYTRLRRDLKAASLMKEKGLWLHRDKRVIGSIPGVSVGDIFFWHIELCVFGLHGQTQAGIDYVCASQSLNGEPIATSIVYSGGYEDDEDYGDVIIYSGQGGKDKNNKQCAHQKLEGGNLGLNNSMRYGIELRVIRGLRIDRTLNKVYIYDGLYKVLESWSEVGKSGFAVFKFKLVREPGQPNLGSAIMKLAENLRSDPLGVRPAGYVHLDISLGRENFPVRLYNDVDSCSEPLSFEYLSQTTFPAHVFQQANYQSGCSCVSICGQNCACTMNNGGEFPYDKNGVLLRWKPVIFECGKFCKCPPTCHNRVSQNGLKTQLEVFRVNETSWGVRSLDPIHAGTFICEYTGVILTKEQASLFSLIGDALIYPNTFIYKQRIWGDLSTVFPNFVKPTYPSISIEHAIDVSRYRNMASYIRHNSCPNLMVQPVMHSHGNLYFPHLMIFSMENIPPMKELTLDFGIPGEPDGDAPEMLRISN